MKKQTITAKTRNSAYCWPICKECGNKLKVSNLQPKWICKKCNAMYDSKEILKDNEKLNYKQKSIMCT